MAGQNTTFKGLGLISPVALYALSLLVIPLGAIFLFSFWSQDYLTLDTTLSLKNYSTFWEKPIFSTLLQRSIIVSLSVTIITVCLAYPIAYFVSFHVPAHHKSLWLFLITIPFWTSYLLRVFLWKVILGYNGVLNSGLLGLGFIDEPLTFILYNVNAVVITLAHAFAPFAILPVFVALEKIDRSLLEASEDLGESRISTFLRITLPLSMPGVVGAVLIVFIPTIGDYVTPRLVGGPNGLMIANMIQTQFLKLNNAPMGAAISVIAMVCVAALSLMFVISCRKYLRGNER